MKWLICAILAGGLLLGTGCVTQQNLELARGHKHYDGQTREVVVDQAPHPEDYVLLPFSVALDVLMSPLELLAALAMAGGHT